MRRAIEEVRARSVFFVAGVPKSGTTWLQLLLDAHPQIACRGEGHFGNALKDRLDRALLDYNGIIQGKNTDIFDELAPFPSFAEAHSNYLVASAAALLMVEFAGTKPIIGEKTPDNVFSLPLLHQLFPAARFLLILRDGRDCATSAWFHNLRVSPDELHAHHTSFAHFAAAVAEGWASGVEAGSRFSECHPSICRTISYELLIRDTPSVLHGILEFLGADTAAAVRDHCVQSASFSRLSGGRPRGQEDRASFFRIGQPGDWRRHFDEEARRVFEQSAGPLLRKHGYPE